MKLRYYNDEEIKILKSNIFVKDVIYKRAIEYDVVFKLWCIMMRLKFPELTGKQIFEKAKFDTSILNDSLPYRRIGQWLKNYRKFGIDYFLSEDSPYHSLDKKANKEESNTLKSELLKFILAELKKIDVNLNVE